MSDIVERLRTDANHHKQVAGDCDCRPEDTANWEHATNCLEAAAEIEKLRHALKVLLEEATSFSVSGVYFDEDCMGHKGPELARKALYP